MTKLIEITDASFEQEVKQSTGTVLVYFWATWCGPCDKLAPTVEELAAEPDLRVCKLEIDENPATAQRYRVRSIPTVTIFRDGEAVESVIGLQPKQAYLDAVERVTATA